MERNQRQRCFIKLDQATAVLVHGQYEVTADFRQITAGTPEGLAFLNAPAGAGGGKETFGCRLAAGAKQEDGQQG